MKHNKVDVNYSFCRIKLKNTMIILFYLLLRYRRFDDVLKGLTKRHVHSLVFITIKFEVEMKIKWLNWRSKLLLM